MNGYEIALIKIECLKIAKEICGPNADAKQISEAANILFNFCS